MMKINKRFNELMSFAANEATIALSDLIHQSLTVEVLEVTVTKKIVPNDFEKLFPDEEHSVVMTTTLVGKVTGIGAFVLPSNGAFKLCDVLLNRELGTTNHLDHIEQSALLESGNIVVGCFLNALGYVSSLTDILHKKLSLTVTNQHESLHLNLPKDLQKNCNEFLIRTAFRMQHLDIEGVCIFYFSTADVMVSL